MKKKCCGGSVEGEVLFSSVGVGFVAFLGVLVILGKCSWRERKEEGTKVKKYIRKLFVASLLSLKHSLV